MIREWIRGKKNLAPTIPDIEQIQRRMKGLFLKYLIIFTPGYK